MLTYPYNTFFSTTCRLLVCHRFRTEYFIVTDDNIVITMREISVHHRMDGKPLHLLHAGPLEVLSDHRRLFNDDFISYDEVFNSKIGSHITYWSSRINPNV